MINVYVHNVKASGVKDIISIVLFGSEDFGGGSWKLIVGDTVMVFGSIESVFILNQVGDRVIIGHLKNLVISLRYEE